MIMVHFNENIEQKSLKIEVVENFSHQDTERIAFFLELDYENNFNRLIQLEIQTDLSKTEMELLSKFCKELPYECEIDLKYPILDEKVFV